MFKKYILEILIIITFILIKIPALGHDTFNTDVFKWKVRSYDFSSAIFSLNFEGTIQKYHPGVTLMWLGTFAIKVSNLITDYSGNLSTTQQLFLLHTIQKLFVVVVVAVTLGICFYILRNLYGKKFALLSISLVGFEPFYVGLTREFHLEGLLSTFMLASILFLYWYLQDTTVQRRLVYSGIFAGLSLLTKISGIYLLLFVGLIYLVKLISKQEQFKSVIKGYFKWFISLLLTVVILWPILWVNPLHAYNELVRGVMDVGVDADHIQFYFGKLVGDPGPTYYLVVFALRTSPILFLGVLGLIFVYKKLNSIQQKFVLFLLTYAVFYLIQLTLPSKKLDRYILPALCAFSLISSVFWYWLISNINRMTGKVITIIVVSILVVSNMYIHPNYLSYYNSLFGGLNTGIRVLEPKWMIGQGEIIEYFTNLKRDKGFVDSGDDQSFEEVVYREGNEKVLAVGFQEKYYTQIWPFFREIGAWAAIQDISIFAGRSNYFVYPVWDDTSGQEDRFKLKHIDDIKVRGVVVYKVYEKIT